MEAITAAVTLAPPSQSSLLSLRPSKPSFLFFRPLSPSLNRSRGRLVAAVAAGSEAAPPTEAVIEVIEVELGGGGGGGAGGDEGFGGGGGGGGGDGKSGGGGDSEESSEGGGHEKEKMEGMSMSQKLTLGFAVLVGAGGVIGYMKSGSHKSLAAGGISALLLYYVYTQLPVRPAFASSLGLGISAALLAVMGSRFKKSGKIFPAGVVSLVSLIMSAGYFHGILRSSHA